MLASIPIIATQFGKDKNEVLHPETCHPGGSQGLKQTDGTNRTIPKVEVMHLGSLEFSHIFWKGKKEKLPERMTFELEYQK